MFPSLAQLSLESVPAFVTFVVGGSACLLLINQALTFYKEHIREQPSPANTYATKVELAAVESELTAALSEIARDLKAETASQAGKRKKIYEDVEQLGKDTIGLKTDNNNQTRQLYNLETKVDRILERLPRIS